MATFLVTLAARVEITREVEADDLDAALAWAEDNTFEEEFLVNGNVYNIQVLSGHPDGAHGDECAACQRGELLNNHKDQS